MIRLLLAIVAAILAGLFAADNMHRVQIGFVVGPKIHVRLFFVIMTAFLGGCVVAMIVQLYFRVLIAKRDAEKGPGKQGKKTDDGPDYF